MSDSLKTAEPVLPAAKKPGRAITQQELDYVYQQLKTPYKYGMVVTGTADQGAIDVDCQGVFKYENKWYMTYVSYSTAEPYGYRTNLASSDDLIHWKYEGVIFQNTAELPQCAAFLALQNIEWGGSNELKLVDGKYWFTTMEGVAAGYEGEPMNIGRLTAENLSEPSAYEHSENLILKTNGDGARFGERQTLYKSNIIYDPDKTTGHEYVMFYNAKEAPKPPTERIFMAVSDDMRTWERYGDSYVLYIDGHQITGDPQVIKMGNLWVMNLFTYPNPEYPYDTFAVSTDLVNWTLWNGEPTVQGSEEYDERAAHKPWVIKENGIVYHFYCARNNSGRPRGIALAASVDLTLDMRNDTEIQSEDDRIIKEINNDDKIITVYGNGYAAALKGGLKSKRGYAQAYELSCGDSEILQNGNILTVISPNGEQEVQYTIDVYEGRNYDDGYIIAETFSNVPDDAWGFTGSGQASVSAESIANAAGLIPNTLKLFTKSSSDQELTKIFNDEIALMNNVHISFDWQSNVEAGKGRSSYLTLRDRDDKLVFGMFGTGSGKICYMLNDETDFEKSIDYFSNAWYRIELDIDFVNSVLSGSITNLETNRRVKSFDNEEFTTGAKNLASLYAKVRYNKATMSIDNVYINGE